MLLKKIILNNIRSYKHQEIIFPEGSLLLSGDIGSGKTSILLGIEFALFGLQPGQRGSSLLRNSEQEGNVLLEFEVDDKSIIIERTLKRSKTINQDFCSITIDGEKKELAVTELKTKVLELLNYPKEFAKKQNLLYRFTVYTPQEEMKEIILQDAETRINTLRHVFGIDKYKRILENIDILLSKVKEEKKLKQGMTINIEKEKEEIKIKEDILLGKKQELVVSEAELLIKKELLNKVQEDAKSIATKIEEKTKLNQEVEKSRIMISNKSDSLISNKKSIEQLKRQIEELSQIKFNESEIKQLDLKITADKQAKKDLYEQQLNVSTKINSFNLKNQETHETKKNLSKLELCPTCLQDVDPVYKSNVINKLDSDIAQNAKQVEALLIEKKILAEKVNKIDLEINSQEKLLQELKITKIKLQELKEKQSRLDDLNKMNISFEKDIELLSKHIELLKRNILELSKFDNLFKEKQAEVEAALKTERIAEIKTAELKKEIFMISSQIEELKLKIKKSEEIKSQLEYIVLLEDWISKKFTPIISLIEKNVMAKLKKEFSKLFSEWFAMLVSENFNVHLNDDFTPVIEQQDYEIDYAYLSGGERTAIALAYRLALNQVINSLLSRIKTRDLVILDEPTDGFSEQQLDKMREVLLQLNVSQLIIVSHEQKIEGFVDNIIRISKEQTGSKIARKE